MGTLLSDNNTHINAITVAGKSPLPPGAPVWGAWVCTPPWRPPPRPPRPRAPHLRRPQWCQPPEAPRWSVVTRWWRPPVPGSGSPASPRRWRPGRWTPASTARSPAPASAPCAMTSHQSQSGSRREYHDDDDVYFALVYQYNVEFIKMIKLSVWKVRQINLDELQLKQCCLDVWPKIWKYFEIGYNRNNRWIKLFAKSRKHPVVLPLWVLGNVSIWTKYKFVSINFHKNFWVTFLLIGGDLRKFCNTAESEEGF